MRVFLVLSGSRVAEVEFFGFGDMFLGSTGLEEEVSSDISLS